MHENLHLELARIRNEEFLRQAQRDRLARLAQGDRQSRLARLVELGSSLGHIRRRARQPKPAIQPAV
jgi:hypothetical protein